MTSGIKSSGESEEPMRDAAAGRLVAALGRRAIVLVGLMGSGKTAIGRRLAQKLGLEFVDSDAEIERAAGLTIPEIFDRYGEPYFRDGERRVMTRLLAGGPRIIATGGGAFMNEETRAKVREFGVSIWLKADLDILWRRVRKRNPPSAAPKRRSRSHAQKAHGRARPDLCTSGHGSDLAGRSA